MLDTVLQGSLQECDVYSYTPDIDSDPHAESSDDDESDGGDIEEEDDFLDGFEDDGYHSGGRRKSGGSRRRSGDEEDEEEEFYPPSLNSLPLVGAGKPKLNDSTRRGCLWCVTSRHFPQNPFSRTLTFSIRFAGPSTTSSSLDDRSGSYFVPSGPRSGR